MEYRLKRATLGRAVLVRSRTTQYVLAVVLGLLGLPAALLGALIALTDPLLGAQCGGFGLAFFGACLLIATRRIGPGAFVFDDAERALLVYATPSASGQPEGRLPYSEIAGVQVGRHVQSGNQTRSVHHSVDVVKRDGVRWTLYASQSYDKARAVVDELVACCTLRPASGEPNALLSSGTFEVTREPNETRVRFRKPYRLITQLSALMTVGGICIALLGFQHHLPREVFFAALGFVTLALAAVVVSAVNGANKRGVLRITPEHFRSDEEGGMFKSWFETPIEALHAVCFSYRPNHDERVLMLLDRAQYESLTQGPGSTTEEAISYALSLFGTRKLDVGELSLAQKLELEQLIQAEVERVAGKRLL